MAETAKKKGNVKKGMDLIEGWTEKNGGRNRDLRETGEKRETGQIGEV